MAPPRLPAARGAPPGPTPLHLSARLPPPPPPPSPPHIEPSHPPSRTVHQIFRNDYVLHGSEKCLFIKGAAPTTSRLSLHTGASHNKDHNQLRNFSSVWFPEGCATGCVKISVSGSESFFGVRDPILCVTDRGWVNKGDQNQTLKFVSRRGPFWGKPTRNHRSQQKPKDPKGDQGVSLSSGRP
jgi:hypothetical protein